jgi:hypothetical protein
MVVATDRTADEPVAAIGAHDANATAASIRQ